MAQSQAEVDEAFLNFALESRVISALEAESMRSELLRRRAQQKDLTMQGLLVYKGVVTKEQGDSMFNRMMAGGAPIVMKQPQTGVNIQRPAPRPEPAPPSPAPPAIFPESLGRPDAPPAQAWDATLIPDSGDADDGLEAVDANDVDEEEEVTHTARQSQGIPTTSRRPTGPIPEDQRPTDKRPDPSKTTDRKTSTVEDSRTGSGAGRVTTNRSTAPGKAKGSKGTGSWSYADDELASTEKVVAAGTIIQASEMTIAQMRQELGMDEGIKLVSDKMQSTVAHLQADGSAERKRYVVIREIARGGMGKVLEVEDTELRRSVALKVLRKELLGRRDVVERFLEEAQITGQLEHPNIVPVHEMGVDGAGNLYFTMKYVEGLSLSEVLLKLREGNRDTKRDYPLLKLLDIFIKIVEGMAFAHNRGVIHRDLKPANIMVGKFGEVQVMDWGVAKIVGKEVKRATDKVVLTDRLEGGSAHTMMGAVIGTPSYMAPEQARGDVDKMGPATDIFSLGIILYEMLAMRSPWTGKTSDEVLDQVRDQTPMTPLERNPQAEVPLELQRLCMKCLQKDPNERVGTAKELADNVRSFIEGRALGAVEYSVFRLAAKWVGRHKKEVMFVVAILFVLVGAVVGTSYYLAEQDRQRILGASDEGAALLLTWKAEAESGKYTEAEAIVDQAKEKFQLVLTVRTDDPTAREGLDRVKGAQAEIREMRLKAEDAKAQAAKIRQLLESAGNSLKAGTSQTHMSIAHEHLMNAISKADAVLAVEANNERALEIKADATYDYANRALAARQWDVCDLMIRLAETTNLRAADLEKLKFELQRRRPG